MRRRTAAVILGAALAAGCALASRAAAEPPDIGPVLTRAGEYVLRYEALLAAIVAEETYAQRYFTPHESRPSEERLLRSEVLIVRLPIDLRWLMYRDVLSVDGRAVSDQRGRLESIFRESPASASQKARALARESARFNVGPIERNFNIPTLGLAFLIPDNQRRVTFRAGGEKRADGHAWVILKGVETARPTLLRAQGLDMPLIVEYWIAADSGAVYRADLSFASPRGGGRGRLTTTYAWNPNLQVWLPFEMSERYDLRTSPENLSSGYYVEGTARYHNVRQFEVTTEEEVGVRQLP